MRAQPEDARVHLAEFAAALDKTQTMIQQLDGTILFWNSGSESFYGWPREEALGRKSHELLESHLPLPFEQIQTVLLEQGSWTGEFKQRRRDGSIVWVSSYWILHRDARGEPVSVIKVNHDITALKCANQAFLESEARARALFDNAAEGILTVGQEGRIVDVNLMVERLFGYSRGELIGAPIEMLLPEGLRATHAAHRAGYALHPHARPMGQGLDLVARRRDGSEFPVEVGLSYAAENRGQGLATAFVFDITARKQAQAERESLIARLEDALYAKTTLLREVHHRLKNNLAVIAGLISLQADDIEDARAKNALEESQRRVSSMALIHEYLYATDYLDRVNFGQYVRQLAHELCVAYAMDSGLVHLRIEAEEIELPSHRAIPCGLILNELLSNAFKYAFPDGRGGEIVVTFARLESGELVLVCADDGAGIPADFDWRNSPSLGFRIVDILTKQIDGAMTMERRAAGTRFELKFPAARPTL